MAGTVQLVLDIMVFKLAFHTYEALENKMKLAEKRKRDQYESLGEGTAKHLHCNTLSENPEISEEDLDDDLDLISNMSDENTMTTSGPQHICGRKLDKINDSLDIKLNTFLMKWIVIIIFY